MGTVNSAAYKKRNPDGKFAAGDSVQFDGKSADGQVSGTMPVKVVNPWSNKDKVTHTDSRGQPYEGAHMHLPTATVERTARKDSPAKQFEAFHHTLNK